MFKKFGGVILAVALILSVGAVKGSSQVLDVSFFYDQLAPYGEWINLSPYGQVFCPYSQGAGWRPYSDGDWYDSDYGWTFVSSEPWAWAGYHYGRWTFDPECGWVWVPGTVWGPAWVAWRFGGGFCGWAPLPPEVGFGFGVGLELGGYDLDAIPWNNWCFVGVDWFGRTGLRSHIFAPDRNIAFLRETRNTTQYGFEGNRVINRGIDPQEIQRVTHRTIPRYQIAAAGATGSHASRITGNRLEMFQPNLREGKVNVAPKNVTPKHLQVPQEQLLRNQNLEKQNLQKNYESNLNAMKTRHQKELNTLPKGTNTVEVQKRHQNEIQSYQTQHQNEMKVMENRHRRQTTMNNAYHASNPSMAGGGGRKKK